MLCEFQIMSIAKYLNFLKTFDMFAYLHFSLDSLNYSILKNLCATDYQFKMILHILGYNNWKKV